MARLTLSRAVAASARDWLRLCVAADRKGLAGVAGADVAGADCFVDAALAAAVTERVPVNILIALPTRSPLQAATAAANLAAITGRGRFSLGFGPGSATVIEDGHGGVFAPPLGRLRDYVSAVTTILRGPAGAVVRHSGPYFRVAGVGYGFTREELPIVIGASGPRMIRLACDVGDGLGLHLLTPRTVIRHRVALARSLRPDRFPISAGVLTSVHDDLAEAMRRARLEVAAALAFPRFLPRLVELVGEELAEPFGETVRAGRVADAASLLDDATVREFAIVCRPKELHAEVHAFDLVDTLSPVPVGQFCQYHPGLGVSEGVWRDSQARVARAMLEE